MSVLRLENLSASYGAIKALHGIDLEVREGEIVSLLGANGAGKSTTLRAISRMIAIQGGDISFQGGSLRTSRLTSWWLGGSPTSLKAEAFSRA